MKPPLTTKRLLAAGFAKAGHWCVDENGALEIMDLPANSGVYAFAIDGDVQYVGVAANSLAKRLRFYARPGITQRTSLRLNKTISELCREGHRVDVLIAFPANFDWRGLTVKGAEGLEAGLIADFHLPWNIRGASKKAKAEGVSSRTVRKSGVGARIVELIRRRPGMTELEIAKAIYGPSALQPQVNQYCRKLVQGGHIERRGSGGHTDPFVYHARISSLSP
jgi:hypothetical protein